MKRPSIQRGTVAVCLLAKASPAMQPGAAQHPRHRHLMGADDMRHACLRAKPGQMARLRQAQVEIDFAAHGIAGAVRADAVVKAQAVGKNAPPHRHVRAPHQPRIDGAVRQGRVRSGPRSGRQACACSSQGAGGIRQAGTMAPPNSAWPGWRAAHCCRRRSQSTWGIASSSVNTSNSWPSPPWRKTSSSAAFKAAFLPRRATCKVVKRQAPLEGGEHQRGVVAAAIVGNHQAPAAGGLVQRRVRPQYFRQGGGAVVGRHQYGQQARVSCDENRQGRQGYSSSVLSEFPQPLTGVNARRLRCDNTRRHRQPGNPTLHARHTDYPDRVRLAPLHLQGARLLAP